MVTPPLGFGSTKALRVLFHSHPRKLENIAITSCWKKDSK